MFIPRYNINFILIFSSGVAILVCGSKKSKGSCLTLLTDKFIAASTVPDYSLLHESIKGNSQYLEAVIVGRSLQVPNTTLRESTAEVRFFQALRKSQISTDLKHSRFWPLHLHQDTVLSSALLQLYAKKTLSLTTSLFIQRADWMILTAAHYTVEEGAQMMKQEFPCT